MTAGRARLGYIDGLRGIAVLAVLGHHALADWQPAFPLAARIGDLGAHGVDLFFVISGLCLALPQLREGAPPLWGAALRAFLWRRAVRILPAYYATIAVLAVLVAAGLGERAAATPHALAGQLAFAGGPYLAAPFWTLPIEVRWYLAVPFALALFARSRTLFAASALAGGIAFYALPVPVPELGYVPEFCGGVWAASLVLAPSRFERYALPVAAIFGALVLVCEPAPGRGHVALDPAVVVAAVAAVIACGRLAAVRRLLEARALRTVGIASYGIYLAHDPVLTAAHALGTPWWLAVPLAVGAGFVLWALVERPACDAARRHARRAGLAALVDRGRARVPPLA